jgi:AcrR family transcriptional regulator
VTDAAPTTMRERAQRYSPAQRRVIDAALDLFAARGVGGTSLQMIADAIGVTKAAIYYQFRTKEEIVLAVAEVELQRLEVALEAAEAEGSSAEARDTLLRQVVDIAVERRDAVRTIQSDPVIIRFLAEHEPFQQLIVRLFAVLVGDDPGPAARVRAAVLTAAIGGAVAHPFVTDLDDETLRAELLRVTRRLVLLPG